MTTKTENVTVMLAIAAAGGIVGYAMLALYALAFGGVA